MTCSRCREEAPVGARFCPACGVAFGGIGPAGVPPPADVQPALAAIARTAARLCEASDAQIFRVEGDQVRAVAKYGSVRALRALGEAFPISRGTLVGRAVLDRRTIHVRDMAKAVRTRFRAAPLRLLDALRDADWQRLATTQTRGPLTLEAYARYLAEHDAEHLRQLAAKRAAVAHAAP